VVGFRFLTPPSSSSLLVACDAADVQLVVKNFPGPLAVSYLSYSCFFVVASSYVQYIQVKSTEGLKEKMGDAIGA
jgi:hypothetical protein